MLRKLSITCALLSFVSLPALTPATLFSFNEYKIQIPISWHRIDQHDLIDAHRPFGQDILFDSEFNGKSFARGWYRPSEREAATCIIYRMKADREKSLKQQFKAIVQELQQVDKHPWTEGIHILKKGSETVQGIKAKWFSADTETHGSRMRRLDYFLLKKGKLYNVRFVSEKRQFEKLKKSFRKMAKSLVIQ